MYSFLRRGNRSLDRKTNFRTIYRTRKLIIRKCLTIFLKNESEGVIKLRFPSVYLEGTNRGLSSTSVTFNLLSRGMQQLRENHLNTDWLNLAANKLFKCNSPKN